MREGEITPSLSEQSASYRIDEEPMGTDDLSLVVDSKEAKRDKDLEELRAGVFAFLEERGILEQLPDGTGIIDTDKLTMEFKNIPPAGVWSQAKYPEFGAHRPWEKLQHAFRGITVISRADYEQSIRNKEPFYPKPLFYSPDSAAAALDPRLIKEEDFYIGAKEMPRLSYEKTALIAKDGERVDSLPAALASFIYHPRYGNGYRDQNGVLQVWWREEKEFKPISANWFRSEFGRAFGSGGKDGVGIWNPIRFLHEKIPVLAERGLLLDGDFNMRSDSSAAEIHRVKRKVSEGGFVMLNGVKYYIGKGEKFADTEVVKLAPGLGGVTTKDKLSGRSALSYIFNLVDKTVPGLKRDQPSKTSKTGSTTFYATKEQTNLQPFAPEEYFKQRADESPEAYARRLKAMQDVDYLLKLSDKFSREAGVNMAAMDFADQGVVVDAIKGSQERPERLLEFAKNYQLDGLQTFAACAYGDEYRERVLKIGERYESNLAQELFTEFVKINALVKDTGDRLGGIFGQEFGQERADFIDQFQEAMIRRLKDIINVAYQISEDKKASADFYGRNIETIDKREPIEALRKVRGMVEVVSRFLSDNKDEQKLFQFLQPIIDQSVVAQTPQGVTREEKLWTCYRFAVEPIPGATDKRSHLMVQLRKYGAPMRANKDGAITSLHNKEIEFDGEARINFVWIENPQDSENVSIATTDPERQRGVSFRLDREGKLRDSQGNLIPEKNDPTRPDGELSLEIGAVPGAGEPLNNNTIIGKNIAIGQYYATHHDARERGNLPQYYHNRASFSKEFGQADFFAQLVEKMARSIEERYVPATQ